MNTLDKNYRHELKFIINNSDIELLKKKISLFMHEDNHYEGEYFIKSLYFDDIYNSSYQSKLDGDYSREKYRIRIYSNDKSYISLELKGKDNNLSYKEREIITYEEYNHIIKKEYDKINIDNRELLGRFLFDIKNKNLIPSIIVDYYRCAYVYDIEDVRITFDRDIKSGLFNYNLFDNKAVNISALESNETILEVKYNDRLPSFIKEIINNTKLVKIAVSKYVLCMDKKGI